MSLNVNTRKIHRIIGHIGRIADELFLAAEGMYLAYIFSLSTMLSLDYPEDINDIFGLVLVLFGTLRVCLYITSVFLAGSIKSLQLRHFMVPAGVCAAFFIYFFSFQETGYDFLVFLIILTIGNIGIDYRWICRTYVFSVGISLITVLLLGLSGSVKDLVYFDNGAVRGALGICYPTDMASYVLFFVLALAVAFDKMPWGIAAFLGLLSALVSRFIASSDTSFICSLAFIVISGLFELDRKFFKEKNRFLRVTHLVLKWTVSLSFLIIGSFFIRMMLAYDLGEEAGLSLNNTLNFRLSLASDAWNKYGVTLFGTPFDQEGAGFTNLLNTNYNFVDSSYPLILLRYGAMVMGLLAGIWVYLSTRAEKTSRRLAAVLVVVAIHSFMEHHFIEPQFNVFLLLPFASFSAQLLPEQVREKKRGLSGKKAVLGYMAVGGILTAYILYQVLLIPGIMYRIKTIVSLGNPETGTIDLPKLLIAVAITGLILFSIWRLYALCRGLIVRRKGIRGHETDIPVILLGIVVLPFVLIFTEIDIANNADKISALVESERSVIEGIIENADGKVYECEYPVLYRKEFKGLSKSLLSEEELARCSGITVLTDAAIDSLAFPGRGYEACSLSSKHVIYTDDESVKDFLRSLGYELKWFNPSVQNVDLERLAELSDIPYSERGPLQLMGKSVDHGPYLSVGDGLYSVKYVISIDPADYGEDHYVGTISVRRRYGMDEMAREDIFTDMFDSAGNLEKQYEVWLQGAGCEFLLYMGNNSRAEVEAITYQRIQ